jgi:hypothetical protein
VTTQTDAQSFLMGTGVKSFKFDEVGKTVKGTVLSLDLQQQRDLKTKEPKFWDKEKEQPMMQLRIVLQTDAREDDNDDGQRAVYAKGNMQNATHPRNTRRSMPRQWRRPRCRPRICCRRTVQRPTMGWAAAHQSKEGVDDGHDADGGRTMLRRRAMASSPLR